MSVFALRASLVGAMLMSGVSANAAINVVSRNAGTFVERQEQGPGSTGVYGAVARLGGLGTWETSVGTATGQGGYSNSGDVLWGLGSGNTYNYTMTWNAGTLSLNIGGNITSYLVPLTGNTLRIAAFHDATVTLASLDGAAFNRTLNGDRGSSDWSELLFYSDDGFGGNGFTATGTIRIGTRSGLGASSSGVSFTTGNFMPPLPEPATWALMIGGFGLVGGAARRRRAGVATA